MSYSECPVREPAVHLVPCSLFANKLLCHIPSSDMPPKKQSKSAIILSVLAEKIRKGTIDYAKTNLTLPHISYLTFSRNWKIRFISKQAPMILKAVLYINGYLMKCKLAHSRSGQFSGMQITPRLRSASAQ